jgi:hypothetical protein
MKNGQKAKLVAYVYNGESKLFESSLSSLLYRSIIQVMDAKKKEK